MNRIQQTSPASKSRIDFLDGLRCIAVVSVVFYHYFYALPKHEYLVAYGDYFASLSWIKYGNIGVQLFFVISGFVITLTLHNSTNLKNFAIKRFARLWPTMLLCSVLTFCFSFWGNDVYTSRAINFFPSLTFLDPILFQKLVSGEDIAWMDGAYWSLFVEVRFYIIVSLLYFYNKDRFFVNFITFLLVVGALYSASMYYGFYNIRSYLYLLVIANYLPWFAFGIGCYFLHIRNSINFFILTLASVVSLGAFVFFALGTKYMGFHGVRDIVAICVVFPLMLASLKLRSIKNILSMKPISAIGIASYSLYLLHQNIGEKLIIKIGNPFNLNPLYSGLYPLAVFTMLIISSYLIYMYYESPINRAICKYAGSVHMQKIKIAN